MQVRQVCFSEVVADASETEIRLGLFDALLRSALRFLVSFCFLPLFQIRSRSSALLLFLDWSLPRLVCLLGICLIGRLTGVVIWQFFAHLVLLGRRFNKKHDDRFQVRPDDIT